MDHICRRHQNKCQVLGAAIKPMNDRNGVVHWLSGAGRWTSKPPFALRPINAGQEVALRPRKLSSAMTDRHAA